MRDLLVERAGQKGRLRDVVSVGGLLPDSAQLSVSWFTIGMRDQCGSLFAYTGVFARGHDCVLCARFPITRASMMLSSSLAKCERKTRLEQVCMRVFVVCDSRKGLDMIWERDPKRGPGQAPEAQDVKMFGLGKQ